MPVPKTVMPHQGNRFLGCLCVAAALLSNLPHAAEANDDAAWVEAQRSQWNIPGVAVAIVEAGKPVRFLAAGLCNIERRIPCTADTPFRIGSITKFVTGLLAATLASEKVVRLDEPLIERWPEFRLSDTRWTEVTLRDLLSQRSGLGSIDWPSHWDQSLSRQEYVARIAHFPMNRPFRGGWRYANANFVAAGAYLEKVTGRSWEALVQQRILDPLEMRSSGFRLAGDAAVGYDVGADGNDVAMPVLRSNAIGPAGTLVSTARDMSNLLQAVVDSGQPAQRPGLASAAINTAAAPVVGIGFDRRYYGPPGGYGFGVFTASYRGNDIRYHGGGYGGFSAHVAWLPWKNVGVAVLTNRNVAGPFAEVLTLGLIDRALGGTGEDIMARGHAGRDAPPRRPAVSSPAPPTRPLARYAGQYRHPAWGVLEIVQDGERLKMRFGTFEAPLEHHRYDSFGFVAWPGFEYIRLKFDANLDGDIAGLTLDDAENVQLQKFDRLVAR